MQAATQRTFIDHIVVLVAAIVDTILELDDELELVMEYQCDNGKIDYILWYLRVSIKLQDGNSSTIFSAL
jgi:hypothetical protein